MAAHTLKFLIDTNILIYALNGEGACARFIQEHAPVSAINPIIHIETMAFPFPTSQAEDEANRLLAHFHMLPIDQAVIRQTINIRRDQRIKLPDAIIAATAQANTLILVTHNIRDFQSLPNLTILDPFDHV